MKSFIVLAVLAFVAINSVAAHYEEDKKVKQDEGKGALECFFCQQVIKLAKRYLANNDTEQQIQHVLDRFCNRLPFGSSICRSYIDNNLVHIIQQLENGVSAQQICHTLHQCSSMEMEQQVVEKELVEASQGESKGALECFFCQQVINLAKRYLANNDTEQQIQHVLDRFCKRLPFGSSICRSYVDNNLVHIIQQLENGVSAQQICHTLHQCSSMEMEQQVVQKPVQVDYKLEDAINGDDAAKGFFECQICQQVINLAKHFLSNNQTEQQLQHALDNVCNNLPIFQSECRAFVDQNLARIIAQLNNNLSPHQICVTLRQCSS